MGGSSNDQKSIYSTIDPYYRADSKEIFEISLIDQAFRY